MAVLGIGTDLVQISRFDRWPQYEQASLLRIFAPAELAAQQAGALDGKKLAVHFALKEAFYKALSAMLFSLGKTQRSFSFLTAARFIVITKNAWGIPEVVPQWDEFVRLIGESLPALQVLCSVSHEHDFVVAFVTIQEL